MTENLDLSTHPARPPVKLTIPLRNAIFEQTQLIDRLPGTDDRRTESGPTKKCSKQFRCEYVQAAAQI